MKTLHLLLFLFIFFVACNTSHKTSEKWRNEPLHAAEPQAQGFSPEKLDDIDRLFNEYISKAEIAGAIAVIAQKGNIVYYRATGYEDIIQKTPLQKDAIFRIASQTKAITSVAVMMLYEEGRMDIDAPLSEYLPEFKDPVVLESYKDEDTSYTTRPASREVTARDLLSHTSGYCYKGSGGNAMNAIYAKARIMGGIPEKTSTLKSEMQKIATLPLAFEPGERFCYGLSTDILGYLVETISGQSLESFFRSRIFDPLGMEDTYFLLPEEKHDRLMKLYADSENGLVEAGETLMNYPKRAGMYNSGGGGLSSTAMDYAIFIQMLLNEGIYDGTRILKPETIKMMTHNDIGDLEAGSLFLRGSADKFGLGFEIIQPKDSTITPIPVGSYGWGGAFGSLYWIDKDNDLIVHLVIQKAGDYAKLRYDFIDAVYKAFAQQ